MSKIVAIGANVLDTIATLPKYPSEDTKMRAGEFICVGGGPAATGLTAAKRLGNDSIEAVFLGNCSCDSNGNFLADEFKKYGVDTTYIKFFENRRAFSSQIWLAADKQTRTCVFDKGDLPPFELDENAVNVVKSADLLLVDGNDISAAISAAKIAKKNNTKILYDAGGNYSGIEPLLALSDILIPSMEFARNFSGEKNMENAVQMMYNKFNPEVVVITCGKDGGIMFDGEKITYYPAYPVNVVDTDGAGDVFHGAFAYAVVNGYDFTTCCHFASATAALKCEKVGARAAVPEYSDVLNFLQKNNFTI